MKSKNKKGFTLIELLAVIVILAIIALIAVPVVMNIITKSKKSAFKDSAYGIIKAGELYYADRLLEPEGMTEDKMFTFPNDTTGLDIKGSKPSDGSIIITKEGKVAIGVTDGKYCITKGFEDSDVTVTEDVDNCKAMYKNGIMSSENQCITKGNTCTPNTDGIMVTVKVTDEQTENFYVLADDGNKVTLIMDRNLGDNVAWISKKDYIEVGGTEADFGTDGNNNKGPITALTLLQSQTNTWTNLPEMIIDTFDYSNGSDEVVLGNNQTFKMYARLPKYSEIYAINNSTNLINTPWLYINLYNTGDDTQDSNGNGKVGYWTSTAPSPDSNLHRAHYVENSGYIKYYPGIVNYGDGLGARSVIELSK